MRAAFASIVAVLSGFLYAWQGFEFAVMVWDIPESCGSYSSQCDFERYLGTYHYQSVIVKALVVIGIQTIAIFSGVSMVWANLIIGAAIIFVLPVALLALLTVTGVGLLMLFFGFFWATALPFLAVAIAALLALFFANRIYGPV